MGNGIVSALSDEFYKMSTFADDYYKNIIMPYKEGVTSKPGFLQSMKNWQPWRAFMPQSMGGTYYTKPTPMASTFLRGAGKLLGPASYFISSPVNTGEDARMAEINQRWANQQNQNNVNQGGGQTRGPVGMGSAPIRSAPTGPDLRNRANGGIISLWQR
jgi:hypothetical protein